MELANDPVQPRPFTTTITTIAPSIGTMEAKKLKVLVAIDDSELSSYAFKWALDNILACPAGAATAGEVHNTIVLLHVHQPFHHYVYPAGPGIVPPVTSSMEVSDTVRKLQRQQSANIIAKAVDACKGRKVRVESMVLEGDAKEMICEAVEKIQADFLVVGSRGLGKIKRAFLGSVSDYCAHHANCPVLIVKPHK